MELCLAHTVGNAGENLPQVGKLLGHRRHRTTVGYARLADDHLVGAAEKVGSLIAAAMRGSGAGPHRPPLGAARRHSPGSRWR